MPEFNIIIIDTILEENVTIWGNVNIYGAKIGENTKIGSFVEIGQNVEIGKNCKIESMVFIPEGVVIEDDVFIGPNVIFTNDKYPNAGEAAWRIVPTFVENGASIGAGSRIMCGVTIGKNAVIGMGSVVADSVTANSIFYGEKAYLR